MWWLVACREPPEPSGPAQRAMLVGATEPVTVSGSPPVSLEVGPLAPGMDAAFTVRTLFPLENAYVTWSTARPGSGGCPARLAGACLDLVHPAPLVGPAAADLSYRATLTAPWTLAEGPVTFQAVVFRLDGTVETSPVVARAVYDPAEVRVGDVTVASAADLAALAGVRAITGSLTVSAVDEVSLPDLAQIGGDLVAWDDDALGSLSLPALQWIGGDLSLYDDPALTSLDGLSSLESVGGTLSLNRLDGLTHLGGLDSLAAIGDGLYVFHDVNLTTLRLPALERIGGSLTLFEDYALTTARFPALETVGLKLDLFEDSVLTELDFPALTRIAAYELHHCDAMTGVGHFPGVTAMPGQLTLQYDPLLAEVHGLGSLTSVGAAQIRFDGSLTSLAGLSSLLSVTEDLEIAGNHELSDPGLASLASVGGELRVTDNPALSQCALEGLFDGVDAGAVLCAGNLDDGCTAYCLADTGP